MIDESPRSRAARESAERALVRVVLRGVGLHSTGARPGFNCRLIG